MIRSYISQMRDVLKPNVIRTFSSCELYNPPLRAYSYTLLTSEACHFTTNTRKTLVSLILIPMAI